MKTVTEQEFNAIKKQLRIDRVPNVARLMTRSEAVIRRVAGSSSYADYKDLVRSEHKAKHPRKPQSIKLHEARIEELLAVRSRGILGAHKYACKRLAELGF